MNEPTYVSDGFLSLEHGVDGGRPPSVLPDTQASRAKNASFRGGYPKCRPKCRHLDYVHGTGAKDAMDLGKFQGAGGFVDEQGNSWVYLSVSGRIWRLPLTEPNGTMEQPNSAVVNSSTRDKAWFLQADKYLLIQDGQSPAIVWNGVSLTSSTAGQIPVGTRMAYGLGRIWISKGRNYVGGDLIYSDTSKGSESILYFTENTFLAEGGEFSVPKTAGDITGLSFTAKQDAASGEGSLMVFTSNGVFEFDAPVDRTTWQQLEQPLQRFSLLNYGATSHESVVQVNGDLFFRSEDGIRSFYFARRDFGSWGNTPISREVGNVLNKDQRKWLSYASGVLFDNRVLMTAQPERTPRGTLHRRLVALDFDLVSSMRSKLPPAWEGQWELPVAILQVLTVDDKTGRRCIVVGLDEDNDQIQIWEIARESDENQPIEDVAWELESKAYQFSAPMDKKRLQAAEFWLDDIHEDLNLDVYYKPNQSGCWVPWGRYTASVGSCTATLNATTCVPPEFLHPSGRSRVGMGQAPDSMDTTTCEPRRDGYEFQVKLKFDTQCTLKRMRLLASRVDEPSIPTFTDGCSEGTIAEGCQTCA